MSKNTKSAESSHLPYGLYEQIIDQDIRRRIARIQDQVGGVEKEKLDPGDGHAALSEYLRGIIRVALEDLTGDDRIGRQVALCNRVIQIVADPDRAGDWSLPEDVQQLLAIWPRELGHVKPERPDTPLAFGCLLTGTRLDPSLVSQVRKELASADRVDILCSFIKWSGIRVPRRGPAGFHRPADGPPTRTHHQLPGGD